MRVLEVIPTLDQGGAEKQLCLLAAALKRQGLDIHVCALTRSGPRAETLAAAGVPLHEIRKRWKLDIPAYRRLKTLLRKLQPDVVHTWLFAANAYGRQAALGCRTRGGRRPAIVAGERCVDPWKSWELQLDRRLARNTDCIAVNSSGVQEFYVQQGLPAEKFHIIPNAIDVDALDQAVGPIGRDEARAALRNELGIPPTDHVIIAVGRLWPQKRYKDLIWSLDLLKVIRDDVHLVIVGEGPQRWRLERFRRQTETEDRVHFLGERPDVPRLMAGSDCYWIGSGFEGQSNSVMEAMALGLPVVASDIPGNRDLVVDQQTGVVVPLGSREHFARQTNLLLDDPERARSLGAAGRRRMREEFTLELMVRRHRQLYERLHHGADPTGRGPGGAG